MFVRLGSMIRHWIQRLVIPFILVCLLGSSFNMRVKASQLLNSPGPNLIHKQSEDGQFSLPPGFQIVSSTPASLVLDIQAPSYNFESALSEGHSCQVLNADGYLQTS